MSVSNVKLGAVLVGWVTSFFLSVIAGVVAAAILFAFAGANMDMIAQAVGQLQSFTFGMVGLFLAFGIFFIGGYVAGRMAAYAGALNGAMVVLTNIIVLFLLGTFVVTFANKLGFDILDPILKALGTYGFGIFIALLFALIGSVLGGKLGEGYVDRLDLAIGAAAPVVDIHQNHQAETVTPEKTDEGKFKKAQ